MMKNLRLTRSVLLLFLVVLLAGAVFAQPAASDEDEHIVKVLRTTNKAQVLKYVPRVYDFKRVNPHQIVCYFTSALATEEGGAYTFVAPDGKSGKILVICPEHQIPYFDKLAKELDRDKLVSASGSKYIYYRLKHRSAGDIAMLNVLFNYGGELPAIAPDPSRPGQALQADFETNSLLLFGAPSGAENAQKALEEILDVPTPQVEMQVKIYEVQLNDDGAIGLDYTDWKNGPGASLFSAEWGGEKLNAPGKEFSSKWSHTMGYYVDYNSAYFDFLVVKNKAKIVTEASVAAMSGVPALFDSTELYLYFSKDIIDYRDPPDGIQAESIDDHTGKWDREIDMVTNAVPVGINLEITPIIGEENVEMMIDLDVDSITGFANSGYDRDKPMIQNRNFSDRINVPLNKEVVVSGMTRERVINHTKKVPILGSIPVFGWFFGGESARTDKTMVVTVIKPVPIADSDNFMDEDRVVASKATGEDPIIAPEAKAGFDQWLLDSEK